MSAGTIAVSRETLQKILSALDESYRTRLAVTDLCELKEAAGQLDGCMETLVRAIGLINNQEHELSATMAVLNFLLEA